MSNLELIGLSLTVEFMGIDSENELFRKLPRIISSKIGRSVYNRRRRRLVNHLDAIRLKLASHFNEFEDYFIVDSIPLEVCILSRSSRSKYVKKVLMHFKTKVIVLLKVLIIMFTSCTQFVL